MRVLVTNDDGIHADGLKALVLALERAGIEVMVAAPSDERSGASHAISLRTTLRVTEHAPGRISVTGTPVDSVHMAIRHFFQDRLPDLIVSGINRGANLGCDVNYSGTVGGAREGAMLGIPSFAVSLESFADNPDYSTAAEFSAHLARVLGGHTLNPRTFLNVNLPDLPGSQIKGVLVTTLGIRKYEGIVHEETDSSGETTYWMGGMAVGGHDIPGSDIMAVGEGYVSVTPLRLDLTRKAEIENLAKTLAGVKWPK